MTIWGKQTTKLSDFNRRAWWCDPVIPDSGGGVRTARTQAWDNIRPTLKKRPKRNQERNISNHKNVSFLFCFLLLLLAQSGHKLWESLAAASQVMEL